VSVDIPKLAVVLGSVTPPQGDVVEARVHLGATKEVSSWELLLQNWDKKYSPGGTYPIIVGQDGYINIGRGVNVPQIITTHTESIKYESGPSENYLRVSGRCWGEKLFRRVVTKTYSNQKGEAIVKDLMDSFAGLSHNRGGTELVEDTDTTFTKLEYDNTPVFDILKAIAAASDKAGVIGYDFRVAPDGKFEFFQRLSKSSSVSLSEKIESSEYRKDITAVRNKITVYGVADKSAPLDKDAWTESLTPTDGAWSVGDANNTISLDGSSKAKGSYSIKNVRGIAEYAISIFTLNSGKEVNANLYPVLKFFLALNAKYPVTVKLIDINSHVARIGNNVDVGVEVQDNSKWCLETLKVGVENADDWIVDSGFDWTQIKKVQCEYFGFAAGGNTMWIDGLFFGGRRYSSTQEDATSQSNYGLRELVEVDEEFYSDNECMLRAKAILAQLKDPAEYTTVRSTVIDYGTTPLLSADKITVVLPNENVNADFRILPVEYYVNAKTQTLEITLELGREVPLLADYLYALRSKSDHMSRHKIARLI
jgi:hypothetical protein